MLKEGFPVSDAHNSEDEINWMLLPYSKSEIDAMKQVRASMGALKKLVADESQYQYMVQKFSLPDLSVLRNRDETLGLLTEQYISGQNYLHAYEANLTWISDKNREKPPMEYFIGLEFRKIKVSMECLLAEKLKAMEFVYDPFDLAEKEWWD